MTSNILFDMSITYYSWLSTLIMEVEIIDWHMDVLEYIGLDRYDWLFYKLLSLE